MKLSLFFKKKKSEYQSNFPAIRPHPTFTKLGNRAAPLSNITTGTEGDTLLFPRQFTPPVHENYPDWLQYGLYIPMKLSTSLNRPQSHWKRCYLCDRRASYKHSVQ
jgi:hypothetical protein